MPATSQDYKETTERESYRGKESLIGESKVLEVLGNKSPNTIFVCARQLRSQGPAQPLAVRHSVVLSAQPAGTEKERYAYTTINQRRLETRGLRQTPQPRETTPRPQSGKA